MAYIEAGHGDPIVFLHGNPTSSFVWRNVIPHLQPHGRGMAPDLIDMGDSGKLPASGAGSYRLAGHRRYLDALPEQLGVTERVTLAVHLGTQWPEPAWGIFKALCSPAGEDMILERNLFVERLLPCSILRALSERQRCGGRRP
jgi:haloalkane dehalogenase